VGLREHWDAIHRRLGPEAVRWYQAEQTTLDLVEASASGHDAWSPDVGGGVSVLVDRLLERGLTP